MPNFNSLRRYKFAAAAISILVAFLWRTVALAADPVKTDGGLLQGSVEDGFRAWLRSGEAQTPASGK